MLKDRSHSRCIACWIPGWYIGNPESLVQCPEEKPQTFGLSGWELPASPLTQSAAEIQQQHEEWHLSSGAGLSGKHSWLGKQTVRGPCCVVATIEYGWSPAWVVPHSALMVGVAPAALLAWSGGLRLQPMWWARRATFFATSALCQDPWPESLCCSCFHVDLQEENLQTSCIGQVKAWTFNRLDSYMVLTH